MSSVLLVFVYFSLLSRIIFDYFILYYLGAFAKEKDYDKALSGYYERKKIIIVETEFPVPCRYRTNHPCLCIYGGQARPAGISFIYFL